MAAIDTADALSRLAPDRAPCIGAAFVTYTFDARFFEESILATVLQLQEDPIDARRRYLDEARRRLVEAPVMVIADPGMLRGGQRLPYDLLRADAKRTFHPKLALMLFPDGARLVVGSGNLTPGGYGDNAELSAMLALDYRRDAALLRQVLRFLERCHARGEAWERFRAELVPRLSKSGAAPPHVPWLLHTFANVPLLDQFLARLPQDAIIDRVGVLAPFHQEDGAPPDAAVLDRLLDAAEGRRGSRFALDVGVSWEGNAVAPTGDPPPLPGGRAEELWAFLDGKRGQETLTWAALGKHVYRSFRASDGRIDGWRSTRELSERLRGGQAWPVGQVVAFGPAGLFDRASARATLPLWAFPEVRREAGRVFRQPLHGKLIAVAVSDGGAKRTHLLVGSPNASAAALLQASGNVECALHLVIDGHVHLGHLCKTLVYVPTHQVVLRERTYSPPTPSPARWIEDAVYDARERRLDVRWRPGAPRLQLRYPASTPRVLLDAVPGPATVIAPFELDPSCWELEVTDPQTGESGRVPLRCIHVMDLPVVAGLDKELDLEELLMLHAGRTTPGAIAGTRAARAAAMAGPSDTAAVFGTAMTPRQVFQALLGIGAELARAPSIGSFEVLLEGPWGVRKLAVRIVEAPGRGELGRSEAWIYGQELAKVLAKVSLADDGTAPAKARLRDDLVDWLRRRLPEPDAETPGFRHLQRFYEAVHEP